MLLQAAAVGTVVASMAGCAARQAPLANDAGAQTRAAAVEPSMAAPESGAVETTETVPAATLVSTVPDEQVSQTPSAEPTVELQCRVGNTKSPETCKRVVVSPPAAATPGA